MSKLLINVLCGCGITFAVLLTIFIAAMIYYVIKEVFKGR